LVSGSRDKTIRVWNLTTGLAEKSFNTNSEGVGCLLVLDDNQLLASGEFDFLIKLWNIKTARLVTYLKGHTESVIIMICLKKGHMASSSKDLTIKIWNYENEGGASLVATLRSHSKSASALHFLSDDNLLSASLDQTAKIWNLKAIFNYPNRSNLIPYRDFH
jgi:WD40 repeat protein